MAEAEHSPRFLNILSFAFFFSLWTISRGEMTCKKSNSCSCSYTDDQIIDLSPLSGNPKWLDEHDPENVNMYSYNPCDGFDEGTCSKVALCQNTGTEYYDLGTQESANFVNEPQTGQLSILYKSTDSIGVTRTSQIILTCVDQGPDVFGALGETSPGSGYYLFTLSSVHCCPKSGQANNASFDLSLGTFISIGFFGVVLLYLVFGIIIQKGWRGQTGRDVIPNYNIWAGFFGLVKDGTLFVVQCGSRGNYETLREQI